MIFPTSVIEPLVTITPYSHESVGFTGPAFGSTTTGILNGATSGAFPSANRALYIPFFVTKPIIVRNLFCLNGATASGNIDLGIYDSAGTKILSTGSTAQSGTNAVQVVSTTATEIGPGKFYLAVAMDNTTGTLFKSQNGLFIRIKFTGIVQQATAFPLPATATFATAVSDYVPVIGLSTRSTV